MSRESTYDISTKKNIYFKFAEILKPKGREAGYTFFGLESLKDKGIFCYAGLLKLYFSS
jgi:hypothetical protein